MLALLSQPIATNSLLRNQPVKLLPSVAKALVAIVLTICAPCLKSQQDGNARGEAAALQVATETLSALSLTSSWNTVRVIILSGTISTPGKEGPVAMPFSWEDLWDGRNIWYRHSTGSGDSLRALVQNPSKGRYLRREDKSVVAVGQVATLPPFQIPGAALSVALSNSHCEVLNAEVPTELAGTVDVDHIQINCHSSDKAGGEEAQTWAISRTTHLPIAISITLENMRVPGARIVETVKFLHYQTVQGLLIPDSYEIRQGNLIRRVTVETIRLPNPGQINMSDFEASN